MANRWKPPSVRPAGRWHTWAGDATRGTALPGPARTPTGGAVRGSEDPEAAGGGDRAAGGDRAVVAVAGVRRPGAARCDVRAVLRPLGGDPSGVQDPAAHRRRPGETARAA